LTVKTANGVTFGDNDFPLYAADHEGRTRSRIIPCALGRPDAKYAWICRRQDAGMQAFGSSIIDPNRGILSASPSRLYLPIRPVQGSTLTSFTIGFRVAWPHTTLPIAMPQLRMMRITTSGVVTPMCSAAAGADSQGYVSITKPVTADAWYAGGNGQTFTVTVDQNNVIDRSTYSYVLEIVDELADAYPGVLTFLTKVRFASTGDLSLSGPAPSGNADGVTVVTGDRVLVRAQLNGSQNGIYIANTAGAWSLASDSVSFGNFATIGRVIVPVESGDTLGGSIFQLDDKLGPSQAFVFVQKAEDYGAPGNYLTAYGTIWHAVRINMTGISQLAWQ
jgi:hypothetical protein